MNSRKDANILCIMWLVEGPGAYGLGFVHLIGGLSKKTATAALRQLLDAGTLSNLPAGFKAKGARIADDDNPIQPGEWRDIDAGGAELTASLMPLPYKEPSQTLYTLMGFAVDAGKRLASIADMQVGDGNQQAAVGTRLLLERGLMVMSAIHKRLYYAQTQEFEMLARGFGEYYRMSTRMTCPVRLDVLKNATLTIWSLYYLSQTPIFSLLHSELRWHRLNYSWHKARHRCTTCTKRIIVCIRH